MSKIKRLRVFAGLTVLGNLHYSKPFHLNLTLDILLILILSKRKFHQKVSLI